MGNDDGVVVYDEFLFHIQAPPVEVEDDAAMVARGDHNIAHYMEHERSLHYDEEGHRSGKVDHIMDITRLLESGFRSWAGGHNMGAHRNHGHKKRHFSNYHSKK